MSRPIETVSRQDANSLVAQLTFREREVLELLMQGVSGQGIAKLLPASPRLVSFDLENILRKFGTRSWEAAVGIGRMSSLYASS